MSEFGLKSCKNYILHDTKYKILAQYVHFWPVRLFPQSQKKFLYKIEIKDIHIEEGI